MELDINEIEKVLNPSALERMVLIVFIYEDF